MNSSNNDSNRNYPRQRRSYNSDLSASRRTSRESSSLNSRRTYSEKSAYDRIMNNVRNQGSKYTDSDLYNRNRERRSSYSRDSRDDYLRNRRRRSIDDEYKIPHYQYDDPDDEDFLSQGNKKDDGKKKDKKVKNKSKFRTFLKVFFILFFVIIFALSGAVIGAIMGIIDKAPKLELIAIEPNVYTSVIYDADGNEIDKFHGEENREYVTLDKIPENMQHAIVAIEDERFYSHGGIDYRGIARAAYSTIFGSRVEGASTLTQQLIKNNITKVTHNSLETKIQEMYLAQKYEDELISQLGSKTAAKDYILELYLNTIYLNHGYNGVQAAALGYFGKDVSELNLAECAVIAGITNNPSYYSPRTNPNNNQTRQRTILKNMLDQGYISKSEYQEAYDDDVYSRISEYDETVEDTGASVHSYFVDGLFEQVSKDLQEQLNMSVAQANNLLYNGGLQIHSTLDQKIQGVVDEAYLNDDLFPNVNYKIDVSYIVSVANSKTGKQEHQEFKKLVKNKSEADEFISSKRAEIQKGLSSNEKIIADKSNYAVQPQSSMVILDYANGEVKAISGGRGEKVLNRGFNRATDSARQPGSVFKVLAAFTPGIDMGVLTPATVIDDVPLDLNGYKPKNWYNGYRGLSTIRDAIRDSMNIVAVKAMNQAGIDKSYEYLLRMGFTTLENDNHASTALGGLTKGVTNLETTAAYGMLANNGKYYKPSFYTKIYDHNGNLLLEKQSEPEQIVKEATAYCVTDMMKDVITSGTGTKAKFKNSNMPIAGKTGTTQNSRDLTFVGYTPYYAAGIWLGYDSYDDVVKNMENIDQSAHLKVWQYVMEKIHEGLAVKDFTKPSGVVTARICSESGKLAVDGLCDNDPRGSRIREENFVEGTQPTESCDVHKSARFCSESGMSAGPYCPSTYVQVGIVRPEPYNGSAHIDDKKYEIHSGGSCTIHSAGGRYSEENGEGETSIDGEEIGGNSDGESNENSNTGQSGTQSSGQSSSSNSQGSHSNGNVIESGGIVQGGQSSTPSTPQQSEPVQVAPPPPQRTDAVIDDPM